MIKIAFFTSYDPFFAPRFLEPLSPQIPNSVEYRIYSVENPRKDAALKARVANTFRLFSWKGLLTFGISWIEQFSVRRRLQKAFSPNKLFLEPVRDINDSEFISELSAWTPDLLFSVSCPQIFGNRLLAIPRLGCINVHNGRLPDYRGLYSIFWQLRNQEPFVEVTAHIMTPQVDIGPIVKTQRIPYQNDRDTLLAMMIRARKEDANLVTGIIRDVQKTGKIPIEQSQVHGEGRYYEFPESDVIKEFRRRGAKTI